VIDMAISLSQAPPPPGWADAQRLRSLGLALQVGVIPQLVVKHAREGTTPLTKAQDVTPSGVPEPMVWHPHVQSLVADLLQGRDEVTDLLESFHGRGESVDTLFEELLAPTARALGDLWLADRCSFTAVTVSTGLLQRAMREWTPSDTASVAASASYSQQGHPTVHAGRPRSIALVQQPSEQHNFGIAMAAACFRRAGWHVMGGAGPAVRDLAKLVADFSVDAVGVSMGCQTQIDWVAVQIEKARRHSRNPALVVMVGGPLTTVLPDMAQKVGADIACNRGSAAPGLLQSMITSRTHNAPSRSFAS
jgi:MerR family transcriptional regulator, light-induced transcriptional regulator